LHTWDSPVAADLVWAARESELQLLAALGSGPLDGHATGARRAARELLALQSSDWAFMRSRGLAGDYPRERVRNHLLAFGEALSAMHRSMTDFRAMNGGGPHSSGTQDGRVPLDERLRGLTPELELAPLVAPSSPWPRQG
ncbi:MAG: 1,4-alpha-glucan branching protein domain-containing protein, partial [Solirubrobacterales bacterium]